ncbi:MAG: hypothetical protein IT245_01320 [Bacteroidia bacterium]|nr:hypothetical protein [Bacteroidia bacterium]
MKNIISNLKWIPEFYFILASLLWFYVSVQGQNTQYQSVMNFPAIVLVVLFHIQLFLNDYYLGKALALITSIVSIYLIFNYSLNSINFSQFDYSSQILALKLGNLGLINLIMAVLMFLKYKKPTLESEFSQID